VVEEDRTTDRRDETSDWLLEKVNESMMIEVGRKGICVWDNDELGPSMEKVERKLQMVQNGNYNIYEECFSWKGGFANCTSASK
jgi:hypothetical protein